MKHNNRLILLAVSSLCLVVAGVSLAQDITFDKYHSYKEITACLKAVQAEYPHLARLSSMGKSHLGKDIWVIEITNRKIKKPEHKPAMYIDGGTHGNEVTGSEVCLHTIDYLVRNYGKDERITKLLDTRTFYIAPSVNPDSNNLFVTTPIRSLRNNQRPFDEDNDGLVDEDPAEDLNGDGFITMMRKKDPEEGTMVALADDPRIMVRPNKENGEKGVYKVWRSEGIDNDGDEKINEDGRGGVNVNRNYPAYWQPEHKQRRGGVYPLSESESRAIVDFCLAHPNIATVQSYHTSGGFLYQPLAAEKVQAIPKEDQAVFKKISEAYKKATGNITRRPYRERGPRPGPYGFGIFIDWAYMHFGAYSGTTELWKLPDKYDPEKQKKKKDEKAPSDAYSKYIERTKAWYKFIDQELKGEGFVPWRQFDHPTLGKIEIGGWKKFIRSNPPPKFLKETVEKNTMADIAQAELTPLVVIDKVKVSLIQGGDGAKSASLKKEGETYKVSKGEKLANRVAILEVTATARNEGPVQSITKKLQTTRLPQRPNVSDLLILEPAKNVTILAENSRVRIGSILAKNETGDAKSASWLIQLTGKEGQIKIISLSQKGGYDEKIITLK
ncbi:MAG: M14 family metallopeptidase [Candidatus Aminicenantaceae bacterium]